MTAARASAPADGGTDPARPVAASPAGLPAVATRAPGIARRILRKPVTLVALLFLAVVSVSVAAAPLLAPGPPLQQDLLHILAPPSGAHPLGTDTLGRDVLSRLLVGGRTTLLGLVQAVAVLLLIGIPVGVAAGYAGGLLDTVVMRVTDLVYSVPTFIIILVVLSVFPDDETAAMVTLGVLGSPGLIRVLRGNTRVIRQELYVRAARSTGLTDLQLVRRHILPRLTGPVIVQASLFGATAILVETGLGFLGLGVQPPEPSWGNMVAEAAQTAQRQPWLLVPSGGLIALVILALGLVGDGLRDATAERWAGAPVGRRPPAGRGNRTPAVPGRTPHPGRPARSSRAATDRQADLLLSVQDLSVAFPVHGRDTTVVRGVGFGIGRGQTLGIVGESGSGKTVTALALLGLLRGGGHVTGGRALFDGQDLLGLDRRGMRAVRGSGIGLISQDPVAGLDPAYTVGAQLGELVARHGGSSRSSVRKRTLELLTMVRLPEPEQLARRFPHQLSGGMAQRVGIALALAGSPRLLIADEPTTALDVTVQAEVLDLLMDLRERTGTSIILVTHDWGVVAETCDRALVMYAGEVVEEARVTDLFRQARHPYTAGLLAANPARTLPGHRLPAIPGTVPSPGGWPPGCHFADRCPMAEPACTESPVPVFVPTPDHLTRCRRHELLTGSPEAAVAR